MGHVSTATRGRTWGGGFLGRGYHGFDPAHDKLDLQDLSVHDFILVDTAAGVRFLNPGSVEMLVVLGASLGELRELRECQVFCVRVCRSMLRAKHSLDQGEEDRRCDTG